MVGAVNLKTKEFLTMFRRNHRVKNTVADIRSKLS
jgi:hypothetical protein